MEFKTSIDASDDVLKAIGRLTKHLQDGWRAQANLNVVLVNQNALLIERNLKLEKELDAAKVALAEATFRSADHLG